MGAILSPPHLLIDRSHVATAIWWPLGVAVVSVTCMRVRWISHTWKYTQWNIFLFESSDKSPYWTNPHHIGFRYEASLNLLTYFGQCPNDIYILLHIPLSCLSKLPAHGAYDCHSPLRPPDGYSSIANGLLFFLVISLSSAVPMTSLVPSGQCQTVILTSKPVMEKIFQVIVPSPPAAV